MSRNPNIPDAWGIPDDQAKKIQDTLRKKSFPPEKSVQNAIEDLARNIAIIDPYPQDWGWWLTYFFEQLEAEAKKSCRSSGFFLIINSLSTNLQK